MPILRWLLAIDKRQLYSILRGPQISKQSFAGVAGIESSLVIRLENMSLERVCLVANLVVPIHFCLPVISKSEINSIG